MLAERLDQMRQATRTCHVCDGHITIYEKYAELSVFHLSTQSGSTITGQVLNYVLRGRRVAFLPVREGVTLLLFLPKAVKKAYPVFCR
jgi:hypothetical protein